MKLFFFYNNRKPRGFNYKPVYYDPQKEELEKRIAKIKREMEGSTQPDHTFTSSVKGKFLQQSSFLKKKTGIRNGKNSFSSNNLRIILLFIVAMGLLWFIFYS